MIWTCAECLKDLRHWDPQVYCATHGWVHETCIAAHGVTRGKNGDYEHAVEAA